VSVTALARNLADVERKLRTLPLDGSPPDLALDDVQRAFGTTFWGAHRMERAGGGFRPAFLETTGWSARAIDRYAATLAAPPTKPFLYDPERPAREQRNRALPLRELVKTAVATSAAATEMLTQLGLGGQDQLRILICDDAELLGWYGGFRERPFTKAEARALERLRPALHVALLWRRRLADVSLARASFEAAMGALGCPAFLVRKDRSIAHTNDAGARLLASRGPDAAAALGELTTSRRAETIAVEGRGFPAHELLLFRDGASFDEAMARAAARWSLTPRQIEVLAELVRGDGNKSIAVKLGCAEVTIELHVTALLRKSKTERRSELIARFWSGD